jgi:hypothetical protein
VCVCVVTASRAIGDRMLKNQGVTTHTHTMNLRSCIQRQWRITPADLFLVLASDGLWYVPLCASLRVGQRVRCMGVDVAHRDVLSNQEVAQYVCSVGEPEV